MGNVEILLWSALIAVVAVLAITGIFGKNLWIEAARFSAAMAMVLVLGFVLLVYFVLFSSKGSGVRKRPS